jgi:hypothetical protein
VQEYILELKRGNKKPLNLIYFFEGNDRWESLLEDIFD